MPKRKLKRCASPKLKTLTLWKICEKDEKSSYKLEENIQFNSVQSLSRVWLFTTPWITARQASLSNTISQSSLRLTSIESVMPSSHLILCCPLLLLSPIPPSIRVFSNESTHYMRWPKYWSFSFSIIPSKEIPGLIFFRIDWHYTNNFLTSQKSLYLESFKASHVSHSWESVNNHMWLDEGAQAG